MDLSLVHCFSFRAFIESVLAISSSHCSTRASPLVPLHVVRLARNDADASTGEAGSGASYREAASGGPNAWHDAAMATGGGTRLLIATGEVAASEGALPHLIRALIANASELLVMTPMLVSRLQWLASDSDRARYEADERLSTVLGQVETIAPEAAIEGRIGDDTPFTAFADAIRDFLPDHILLALRRGDHSGWQERGLLDQIREFGIPITVFELDRAGRPPVP
jgi:hypothetical protein